MNTKHDVDLFRYSEKKVTAAAKFERGLLS